MFTSPAESARAMNLQAMSDLHQMLWGPNPTPGTSVNVRPLPDAETSPSIIEVHPDGSFDVLPRSGVGVIVRHVKAPTLPVMNQDDEARNALALDPHAEAATRDVRAALEMLSG